MSSSTDFIINDQDFAANAPGSTSIFKIWPGIAPGSQNWDWQPRTMEISWAESTNRFTRNVVTPTLTLFAPDPAKANGTAMIIAPGGAFHFLMIDHEGYDMARWLAARGVTAFVLNYRLGRCPDDDAEMAEFRNDLQRQLAGPRDGDNLSPVVQAINEVQPLAEEDGRQAIRFVRQHASDWAIDPRKIGIGGFSAGGGVAVGALMEHDAQSRPDFAVPIYPGYREGRDMPQDPPPLFLIIADDDPAVSPLATARLYQAWHEAGVPAELHIFGNGAHGFGMNKDGFSSDVWIDLFENWLKVQKLL